MTTHLTLRALMQAHGISANRLHKETEGLVARKTVFNMVRGDKVQRVDLEAFDHILRALSGILGRKVEVQEVLQFDLEEVPTPRLSAAGVTYTNDAETNEILDDVPDILERVNAPGKHTLDDVLKGLS